MTLNVSEKLIKAAEKSKARSKEYGSAHEVVGKVLKELFPSGGVLLKSSKDQERYHILTWIVGKLVRYSYNFKKGGHKDSIHDMLVYCAILEAIDETIKDTEYFEGVQLDLFQPMEENLVEDKK